MIGFFDTAFPAIVQAITPNAVLGRVTTFIEILAVLSVPLSAVLGGWIIDRVGSVSLVFGILGASSPSPRSPSCVAPWPTSSATCHLHSQSMLHN